MTRVWYPYPAVRTARISVIRMHSLPSSEALSWRHLSGCRRRHPRPLTSQLRALSGVHMWENSLGWRVWVCVSGCVCECELPQKCPHAYWVPIFISLMCLCVCVCVCRLGVFLLCLLFFCMPQFTINNPPPSPLQMSRPTSTKIYSHITSLFLPGLSTLMLLRIYIYVVRPKSFYLFATIHLSSQLTPYPSPFIPRLFQHSSHTYVLYAVPFANIVLLVCVCVCLAGGSAGHVICLLLYFHYGFPDFCIVVVFIAAFKCRGMNIDGRLNKRWTTKSVTSFFLLLLALFCAFPRSLKPQKNPKEWTLNLAPNKERKNISQNLNKTKVPATNTKQSLPACLGWGGTSSLGSCYLGKPLNFLLFAARLGNRGQVPWNICTTCITTYKK